ncbi:MAG: response regulator transcription factor [Candidatus Omnitrophica bacterium]|nr:response regulator transcription factor [Candidatus Omnitrophota bacterium]
MKKALIWDPDDLIRTLLREVLEYHGFSVLEAECHERALNLLRSDEVDLILFDWNSESLGGAEQLCDFRSLPTGPRFIALGSCIPEQESLVERDAKSAGAAHLLLKPFGAQDLMRAVDSALNGSCPVFP